MRHLVKLHRKYLFNKINLIIVSLIIILAIILSTILIEPTLSEVDSWILRESLRNNYEHTYLMFVKIIMILLSCYLFTIHFSKINDEYKVLLLTTIKKRKFYFTKIWTIISLEIIIISILLLNYILIGSLFTSWFVFTFNLIVVFIKIVLLSIIYGLISLFMVLLFKNIYSVLLSFGVFFFGEIMLDFKKNKIIDILIIIFPALDLEIDNQFNKTFVIIVFGFISLIVFYYLMGYFLYLNSE